MSYDFSVTTHGKWLLAGEHAVLRSCPAIVFPVPSKQLTLNYLTNENELRAEFTGTAGDDIHLLFWGVIERGLELVNHSLSELTGHFHIENTIPVGAGMGASAALSAAVARWFVWSELIEEEKLYEFARQLENLFHSESSGVDIAGVLAKDGLVYNRFSDPEPLEMNWKPRWFLSYSDQVGMTSHCVKKVKEFRVRNPDLSNRIDEDMQHSVLTAIHALQKPDGLTELATAINQANVCFSQWGLAGGKVEQHIGELLAAGALAAKPTGSGSGGYILSLWSDELPSGLPYEFIPV